MEIMEGVVKWRGYALEATDYVSVAREELDEQALLFRVSLGKVVVSLHNY